MAANLSLIEEGEMGSDTEVEHPKARRIAVVAMLVLAGLLTLLLILWSDGAQRRAIRAMPLPERAALLSRTLENLRSVCKAPEDAMRDFCSEQARLALDFPECDESCKRLAATQLSRLQPPR